MVNGHHQTSDLQEKQARKVSLAGAATGIICVSRQTFCCDKHVFFATKHVFCRNKSKLVLCRDRIVCRDKHNFVVTKPLSR